MFDRLLSAEGQSRSAKTVEVFGWLILFEGTIVLFAPHFAISLLGIEPLTPQTTNYFRLVGLLVSGLGMLYIASGRLNAGDVTPIRLTAVPEPGTLLLVGSGFLLAGRKIARPPKRLKVTAKCDANG